MTFERVVEDHLSPFGPFVAIGRPEEPLSPLGAARDYVPDSDWQDEVQQRIQAAAIVVLIIGTSQGLAGAGAAARPGAAAQADSALSAGGRRRQPVGDARRTGRGVRAADPAEPDPAGGDLALIYADDLTPLVIEGTRDEWSYETALRIGGILAITTGVEPALSRA